MFDFLLSEEEKALKAEARRFAKEDVPSSLVRDMDNERIRYPKEFLQKAASRNLLGLRFSPTWGGRGAKWAGEVAALEEIGVLGSSLSCLYSLVSIVGEAIHLFGTEKQKETYLKPTLQGKLCCAEALTEPRGGSDFFGATTLARRDGNDYILNGQKMWITNAGFADTQVVFAKIDNDRVLSAFIVESDSPGVVIGPDEHKMGIKGSATAAEAFKKIADAGATFISRGDDSGTHKAELKIWKSLELEPTGQPWYVSVGDSMGKTLTVGNEMQGYVFTDKATFLAHDNTLSLLLEETDDMKNTYAMIAITPQRFADTNYAGAQAFIEWMTSEKAADLIAKFGLEEYGEQLFFILATQ